jgi:hypothetical protein
VRTKVGRYLLEDRVLDGPGWSYWRGTDGTLRRPVGVLALDADHPAADDLLDAARASAGADDPRIQRVLDVLTDDEGACLVIEWTSATSLQDLLADGPLPDVESWRITREVAGALAAADEAGLSHGALAPQWVMRGDGGQVRLLGLCVARVLQPPSDPHLSAPGPTVADPTSPATELDDVRGLGALLYAALTGRWAGDPRASTLPAAPTQGGRPVRPRMVRAGVPAALDEVASRALGLPCRGGPLDTPADVVTALELAGEHMRDFDATGPLELDPEVLAGLADTGYLARVTAESQEAVARTPSRRGPALVAVVVAVALVVLGLAGWFGLSSAPGHPHRAAPATRTRGTPSAQAEPTGALVAIRVVKDFDPDGNGTENPDQVRFAVDGNPRTAWHTVLYFNRPDLGGLKPGVGLLLDLGSAQEVGAVRLLLVGHGTSVELRASPTTYSASADGYLPIASADHVGALVTLRPQQPVKVRYLLIWLTSLPLAPDGVNYQGGIAEIEVHSS